MRRTFSDALSSAVRLRLPARDALAAAVRATTGDDWSPEARAAALEARKTKTHHDEKQAYHSAEATKRGESQSKPVAGSHANAASLHGSASFYHEALAKAHEEGNSRNVEHYSKEATKNGKWANSATKKLDSGKIPYPEAKENSSTGTPHRTSQEHSALRIARHLRENKIRMR